MRQLMTFRAWWLLACIPAIWGTVGLLIALLDEGTAEPDFRLGVGALFGLAILFGGQGGCHAAAGGLCTFDMDKLVTLHVQIAQFWCQNASLVSRLSRVLTGVC